jgi:hypothetical protein
LLFPKALVASIPSPGRFTEPERHLLDSPPISAAPRHICRPGLGLALVEEFAGKRRQGPGGPSALTRGLSIVAIYRPHDRLRVHAAHRPRIADVLDDEEADDYVPIGPFENAEAA